MLLHFHDRATLRASLALPLSPELHDLLKARITHLDTEGLLDMTEIVVIGRDTTEPELMAAIGFTPLIDPEGCRYGEPGFCSPLDHVSRVSANYYEAIHCIGNPGFCFHLLIHADADQALVALCREIAAAVLTNREARPI